MASSASPLSPTSGGYVGVTRSLTRKFMELRRELNISTPHRGATVLEPLEVDSPGSSSSSKLLGVQQQQQGLIGESDPSIGVPPIWASEADSLTDLMGTIRTKIENLRILHTKQMQVSIEDSVQGEQRSIEIATAEISRLLGEAQRKIKVLKRVIDNPETSVDECVIIKNVQAGFAAQLSELTKTFRSVQQRYLESTKRRDNITRDSFSKPDPDDVMDDAMDDEKGLYDDYQDNGFNNDQMAQLRIAEVRSEQRGKDLQKVYRSIVELNEMVKDLSLLIIDQGTLLDRIDYNIENAATSVERGVQELQQASNHQRAARSKLCILILIILIIIATAVLFFRIF